MSYQTGPTSAAGRAASSVNATTHNGCSEKLIVEGERLEDYRSLVASLLDHYQPADPHEHSLVEDLAHGRWILWRRIRACNQVESELYVAIPNAGQWTEAEYKRLGLAERYRTTAERSFNRALKNVEAFCKERVKEYRWSATYDLAVRRLELVRKKHELSVVKVAIREKKVPPPPESGIRSAKVAVSSPVAPAAPATPPFSALNITRKNPEKGARIA